MRNLLCTIFVVVAAFVQAQTVSDGSLFSYTAPAGFQQNMQNPINLQLSLKRSKANITILNLSAKGQSYSQVSEQFLQIHREKSDSLKVLSDQQITLGGRPARSILMTRISPSKVLVTERVVAAVKNDRCILVMLALGEDVSRVDAQFKKSLKTFKWLK